MKNEACIDNDCNDNDGSCGSDNRHKKLPAFDIPSSVPVPVPVLSLSFPVPNGPSDPKKPASFFLQQVSCHPFWFSLLVISHYAHLATKGFALKFQSFF